MSEEPKALQLPTLNSRMFKKSGRLRLYSEKVVEVEGWKIELWQDTLEFYCKMNELEVFSYSGFDHCDVRWRKRSQ